MANILVVDDSLFMRTMLKDILSNGGHTIVGEANNGQDAVERFKELSPDLVTMDITMPEANGIEGVTGIIEKDPEARIVMCSAMGQEPMVVASIKAGAKDFVVKPFQAARVQEAVNKALE